jgi:hypothetical protein
MDFFDTDDIKESLLSIVGRLSLVIIALSGFLIEVFLEEWRLQCTFPQPQVF